MLLIYSWILYSRKNFRKLKIWKFNENWKISYLYSEMKFPISYLSLRLKLFDPEKGSTGKIGPIMEASSLCKYNKVYLCKSLESLYRPR